MNNIHKKPDEEKGEGRGKGRSAEGRGVESWRDRDSSQLCSNKNKITLCAFKCSRMVGGGREVSASGEKEGGGIVEVDEIKRERSSAKQQNGELLLRGICK